MRAYMTEMPPAVLAWRKKLRGGAYVLKAADAEGWVRSDAVGVELRAGPAGKLIMRPAGDSASAEALPYV